MSHNAFGYFPELPDDVRGVFQDLCQDVASLHAKWQLYSDLFHNKEDTAILDDLARASFQMIEEALRSDMTMAICRLNDPVKSCGKRNLSIAVLKQRVGSVPGLDTLLQQFEDECAPVQEYRNRRVGHNDLNTALSPRDNPLPGVGRSKVEAILGLAHQILNAVYQSVVDGELGFQPIEFGSGRDLIYWLRMAKQHRTQ